MVGRGGSGQPRGGGVIKGGGGGGGASGRGGGGSGGSANGMPRSLDATEDVETLRNLVNLLDEAMVFKDGFKTFKASMPPGFLPPGLSAFQVETMLMQKISNAESSDDEDFLEEARKPPGMASPYFNFSLTSAHPREHL